MKKHILPFFKNLFNVESNTDEKIVVGFCSFVMMCFIALCTLFFGLTVPFEIFATFATLTAACFGLGTLSSIKGMSVKSEVASDVAKSDSGADSNQTAKVIIQSDKPK